MLNMIYALEANQVGWFTSRTTKHDQIRMEFQRAVYFKGIPNDKTIESGYGLVNGVRVSLFNRESQDNLGTVSISYATVEGKNEPIDQDVDLNCDDRVFGDILRIRDSKSLYLSVDAECVTDGASFKEFNVTHYRISLFYEPCIGFKLTRLSKY